MTESGFLGMVFNNFFAFSGFMGTVFCRNSSIDELFSHFRIYGYDLQKFSRFFLWVYF